MELLILLVLILIIGKFLAGGTSVERHNGLYTFPDCPKEEDLLDKII